MAKRYRFTRPSLVLSGSARYRSAAHEARLGRDMERRRKIGLGSGLAVVLLVAAGVCASASVTAPSRTAQIDPLVVRQIKQQGETTFWVVVRGKADLSKSAGIKDW